MYDDIVCTYRSFGLVLTCWFRLLSDGLQPSLDVSTLNHDILLLVGQNLWPIHYSMDSDFKLKLSLGCHIQQDDLSAAYLGLHIAVLHDMLFLIFLVLAAASTLIPLQMTSTGNSQVHLPLSLQSAIRSAYLRLFLTIFFPWHCQYL